MQVERYPMFDARSFYGSFGLNSEASFLKQLIYQFGNEDTPYKFVDALQGQNSPSIKLGLFPSRLGIFVTQIEAFASQNWRWDDHVSESGNRFFSSEKLENEFGFWLNPHLLFDHLTVGIFYENYWRLLGTSSSLTFGEITPWLSFRYQDKYRTRLYLRYLSVGDYINYLRTSRAPSIHVSQDFFLPKLKADISVEAYYSWNFYNASLYRHNKFGTQIWFRILALPNFYIQPNLQFAYSIYDDYRVRIDPVQEMPYDIKLNIVHSNVGISLDYYAFNVLRFNLNASYNNDKPTDNQAQDYTRNESDFGFKIEYFYPEIQNQHTIEQFVYYQRP